VLSLPAYRLLQPYVNATKHRSLILAAYSISLQPDQTYGLRISGFEYKGSVFEARWATAVTIEYRASIGEAAVALGLELNRALEAAEVQHRP